MNDGVGGIDGDCRTHVCLIELNTATLHLVSAPRPGHDLVGRRDSFAPGIQLDQARPEFDTSSTSASIRTRPPFSTRLRQAAFCVDHDLVIT